MEYIIVGDYENLGECLIYTIKGGRDFAEQVLDRILNNPDEQDKAIRKEAKNIRIKEVVSKDCWWNDPFLAN